MNVCVGNLPWWYQNFYWKKMNDKKHGATTVNTTRPICPLLSQKDLIMTNLQNSTSLRVSSFRPPVAERAGRWETLGKRSFPAKNNVSRFFRLQWEHFGQDLWLCIYMFAAWGMWQSSIKVALEVKLTIKLGKYDWTPLWALPNTRAIFRMNLIREFYAQEKGEAWGLFEK